MSRLDPESTIAQEDVIALLHSSLVGSSASLIRWGTYLKSVMVASRVSKHLKCSSVIVEGYIPLVCADQPAQEIKERILGRSLADAICDRALELK